MPFKPGEGGRPKGAINKSTKLVKEVFADAFEELQKDPDNNLVEWGKREPTEFYKLASKLIPQQIAGDHEQPLIAQNLSHLTDEELAVLATAVVKISEPDAD
jgi:hypothetical protein